MDLSFKKLLVIIFFGLLANNIQAQQIDTSNDNKFFTESIKNLLKTPKNDSLKCINSLKHSDLLRRNNDYKKFYYHKYAIKESDEFQLIILQNLSVIYRNEDNETGFDLSKLSAVSRQAFKNLQNRLNLLYGNILFENDKNGTNCLIELEIS